MIPVKEAITAANKYMTDIYGTLKGPLVEEVEFDQSRSEWLITIGFWQSLPPAPSLNALAEMLASERVKRVYKLLRVDSNTGEVLSMKIRPVPTDAK